MDKHTHLAEESGKRIEGDAFLAAESVRRDFSELVALFDWHLDSLAQDDTQARMYISSAREAARRGLRLTSDLVSVIKAGE